MFGIDAPEPEPVPEPEEETARRKGREVRRRRARSGRASTINPSRAAGGPQPAAQSASRLGMFSAGLGLGNLR